MGFTLIELLVAMSILTILGTALIVILRGGLETWRRAEARRESYDQAAAVFLQMREDLSAIIPPYDTPLTELGEVEARFLCDDPYGRLFFVRAIKAESEHPITGLAGNAVGADAVLDQNNDLAEARAARLRATGGAMEVAWVIGRNGVLYRGVRAPVGPPASLFDHPSPYDFAPLPGEAAPAAASAGAGPVALLRPFARGIIHVEFRFWSQYTTSWAPRVTPPPPPLRLVVDPERDVSGPLNYWDSTRALLQPDKTDPKVFDTFVDVRSLYDPRDDILPAKVRVELILEEPPAAKSSTFLTKKVAEDDSELFVQEPERLNPEGGYLYVGGEWIRYEDVRGDRVLVATDGRGARATQPREHDGSNPVHVGRSFVAIFDVPGYREDWSDYQRYPPR